MLFALSQLVADHSVLTVLAALVICLTSGWLLAALFERSTLTQLKWRPVWRIGAAIVAGLGVWTTHFLAMMGYRPDLPLTYGASITIVSVAIGVLCVGMPLAATAFVPNWSTRAMLGAGSGLGIAAMHVTGMSALSGCFQEQGLGANLVACLAGMLFMGLCCGLRFIWSRPILWAITFTIAVCSVHFISISGTVLTAQPDLLGTTSDKHLLGILIAIGASVLLGGTLIVIMTSKRFDAQEQAHSTILSTALQNMSNGLVFIKASGKMGLFNDRFVELFDLHDTNLTNGMPTDALFCLVASRAGWDANRLKKVQDSFAKRLAGHRLPAVDHIMPNNRCVSIDSNPVLGGGVVFTFDDVTEERAAQQAIADLAYNDPLTGLPNRRSFWQQKVDCFNRGEPFELLLIDLDRFKAVNDTFGHAVGDALLVQVGKRIRSVIGDSCFLARLGGDELAVLVMGDKDQGLALAESLLANVSKPYVFDQITANVGCSIGLCSGLEVQTPDELMQCADVALYEAKRRGRGHVVSYVPGLLEAVSERHRLEADLREALPRGEFHLAYQPVMTLESDVISGYEALIRWTHPVRGNVTPVSFIPLAEEIGLITEIGTWVLEQACLEAASWDNERHVAVNVSAIQFRAPDFIDVVKEALEKSGLAPNRLELELTETALVEDGRTIAQVLQDLRKFGVRVAMDDFGTGYSSLAHICDFPLDRIKIDRSFVSAAQSDIHAHAIVKAVVALGRDIGIPTLAEGVETPEQLALLRSLGCESVQGYLIGKPGPI